LQPVRLVENIETDCALYLGVAAASRARESIRIGFDPASAGACRSKLTGIFFQLMARIRICRRAQVAQHRENPKMG